MFSKQPITFRRVTARRTSQLDESDRAELFAELAMHNAAALHSAIEYCAHNAVGSFRINSQILPLSTHPDLGYPPAEIGSTAVGAFRESGRLAKALNIRLSFHPDPFVVLSTPRASVLEQSLRELEYQAEVAGWVGADVINIHAGGSYGQRQTALARFARALDQLSDRARRLLTVENDDRTYSPADLLPYCRALQLPLVYDVHHHRCRKDGLSVDAATDEAMATWNREPLFHVSSPKEGWRGKRPQRHHDFIHLRDFPERWEQLSCTVDVEAKAKEVAIRRLQRALKRRRERIQDRGCQREHRERGTDGV